MDILYNFSYIFLIFFIYSVFGYLCEIVYTFIYNKFKFENRGFLYGPYCPIYGFGAMLVIFVLKKYHSDPIALFVMTVIVTSILEYLTSYIMEKIFANKWWDYSHEKFNINGRVCIKNSLLFGVMGIIVVYCINPFFDSIILGIGKKYQVVFAIVIFTLMIYDTIRSFNVAMSLKKKLKDIREDVTRYIIEEHRKSKENSENIKNELVNNLKEKMNELFENKKDKKLMELLSKLPKQADSKKIDAISIIKENIEKNKKEKMKKDKKQKIN